MAETRPDVSDLSRGDVREIAGRAGGLREETVDDYLSGARETQSDKRRAIERVLRDLGWGHLVRPPASRPGIVKA